MRVKYFICLFTILFTVLPVMPTQGRIREKTITFSAATGHNHDGASGGKIVYLPAIAVTDVNVCANLVCQLALVAEEGDVCVRTDENKSYVHNGGIVGDITDWTTLLATGIVTSINGALGDVVLNHSDLNNIGSEDHHSSTSSGIALTPSSMIVTKANGGDAAFGTSVSGDVNARLLVNAAGSISFSDGTSSFDTNLYRAGANTLQTDSVFSAASLSASRTGVGLEAVAVRVAGDPVPRLAISAGGGMDFSSGAAGPDVNLYRLNANTLKTDDTFQSASIAISGVGSTMTYANSVRNMVIGPATFRDDVANPWGFSLGSLGASLQTMSVTPVYAVSNIRFNNGIVITSFSIYGITAAGSASNSVIASLYRATLGGAPGSGQVLASCTMANGANSCATATIAWSSIDVNSYRYGIHLRGLWASGVSTQYFSSQISYVSNNVLQ